MGYKFQFVTLAGFHSLNHGMFELARGYRDRGMAAYTVLQEAEFASEAAGYTATRHQHEVGAAYFDAVSMAVSGGAASTDQPRWRAPPRRTSDTHEVASCPPRQPSIQGGGGTRLERRFFTETLSPFVAHGSRACGRRLRGARRSGEFSRGLSRAR